MSAREHRIFGSRAFVVGLTQAVLWAVLGLAMMRVVPSFVKVFEDFGTTLPTMTIAVMRVTDFLNRYWYLGFLPLCVWPYVTWGVVCVLSPTPETVRPRRLWYFATWLAILLALGMVVVALFLPLVLLQTNLSK